MRRTLSLALGFAVMSACLSAATFTVINTNDSGAGSLARDRDANAGGGADTIAFAIPGAGVHTIVLASELPSVTDVAMMTATRSRALRRTRSPSPRAPTPC